jgi:sugar diacid utilization regulator
MFASDVGTFGRLWRERLESDPLAARVVATLWHDRERYATPVMARARRENPVIDTVIESDFAETRLHVLEHFRALLSLPTAHAAELGDDPLAFVRAHGVRRARAGVPLRAVLQAYRTGHKSFWSAICDKLNDIGANAETSIQTTMLLSDYLIDYTDLISVVVTDAYIAEESQLAAQRTRLSIAVLESLLRGERPHSREGRELCETLGITAGRSLVAFAVRQAEPEPAMSAQERSAAMRQIDAALPHATFGRLIDLRLNEIAGIISCAESAGVAATRILRQGLSAANGRWNAALAVGIGLDAAAIEELPRSYAEAVAAIEISGARRPVAHLGEVSVDAWLRHKADATARRLTPAWTNALRDSRLVPTLEAFAAASLNVKACANLLKVHNNTVYHRLNSVRRLTGVNPRTYAGLSHLLAVASLERKAER